MVISLFCLSVKLWAKFVLSFIQTKNSNEMKKTSALFAFISLALFAMAQNQGSDCEKLYQLILKQNELLKHRLDVLEKMVDDNRWYAKIGDIAYIDKVFIYGPPLAKEKNPTGQGAGNPTKFWSYVFVPKDVDPNKKYPLLVLPHGGVHASMDTYYAHIIREMIAQQYIVVAAEYRGSTGYGQAHYKKIDYGGLEIDDVDASRKHMIDNYDIVDKDRVGIIGWSHGGLIALLNIFEYPSAYKVAYAGVPVSDLIARMGYKDQSYNELFSADYHIGKPAHENVEEYKRRSPAWQAHKLKTPLLIHTNTNDEDVNVLEVEHLIKSLKAEGKKFEYKIFENLPGGHSFDRMDTKLAREIRFDIYKFLGKYLNPPKPFKTIKDLSKAAYYF
jgi:dipeptidyl aminopeptidase/acylaminoacyl peptidase